MPRSLMPLVLVLACTGPTVAQESASGLEALVNRASPSIVTILAIMKFEMFGDSQEVPVNLRGTVVSEDGLILASASQLSPGSDERGPKMTLLEVKVIVGNEDKEYGAFLAATETKFDLAFLQIKDLGDRKLAPIDLSSSTGAELGDEVVTVLRLDKGYDYAPYFLISRINGSIRKPSKALMVDGQGPSGLPVFAMTGEVVGVHVTIESGVEDGGMSGLFGFGGGSRSFVLSAKVAAAKVELATRQAAERLEEERKKAAEAEQKQADGEKKNGQEGDEKKKAGDDGR